MGRSRNLLLLALPSYLCYASAVSTNDQTGAKIDYGTFTNPPVKVRPLFRYWVPDASVNLTQVAADIKDAGRVGAGGVELLGYYGYGDVENPGAIVPTDWTGYGWGTPSWRKLLDAALDATHESGLIIDIALGPSQGAGVPAPENSEGLQWDLQPFNVTVPAGKAYNAVLPGWGAGSLVSASTGLVVDSFNSTSAIYKTLSAACLTDVTGQVDSSGHVKLQFPEDEVGEYVLFAYYLIHTGYREQETPALVIPGVPQSPITDFIQNGSWVVDHFSAKGAKVVTDFWQSYLLNGSNTAQLLKRVGNYVWEDSQEFPANVFWTPSLPDTFRARHGYSISEYLPVLLHGNTGFVLPGTEESSGVPTYYITDEADSGDSHVADYRQTLTELNSEYLEALATWADSIGLQYSTQVAYNLPMDMLANIPYVNAPETETLGFSHSIDGYRQYAGPANLAGKRVVSSECGALLYQAFQQTIPGILWDIKRSIVGGVNNFVLHGYPYTGNYPNSTWPTWTTLFYLFSEQHNRHQPGWDFYGDFLNYTARVQFVSQTGVPKRDFAFWLKNNTYSEIDVHYMPTDLQDAGYTYEYLSPDDFSLPAAIVADGILAPSSQSFKAIVVRGNDTMTASGVEKLSQWAHQGLPIVFSGGIPSKISGSNESAVGYVNATLSHILPLQNVHVVPYANLAHSLASLDINPRTAFSRSGLSNTTWYTNWREDESNSMSYIFVYNDATGLLRGTGSSTGNITIQGSGIPYLYDAWTGGKNHILQYQHVGNSTMIPTILSGNQTAIIALDRSGTSRPVHIKGASSSVTTMHTSDNHHIVNFNRHPCHLELSNGSTVTLPPNPLTPVRLQNWTLTIESWTPPKNLFDVEGTVKTNETYTLTSLQPWNLIANTNLSHVSGRGYYSTTFSWPPSPSIPATGAQLDLGSIVHTARAFLNGHALPPLDVTAAKADLTPYLKAGINRLEVVVATPYGNALIPVWKLLRSSGSEPEGPVPVVAEYGLVGDVVVRQYVGVEM